MKLDLDDYSSLIPSFTFACNFPEWLNLNTLLYIRKYPIRFTPQHIAVNVAYKILISKLLETVEDFVNNLWFAIGNTYISCNNEILIK